MSSDLITTHPSIASQVEKMETPTSQLSPDCCQTEDALLLDSDVAVDPVLRREMFEELQKEGKFLSARDNAFQGSL